MEDDLQWKTYFDGRQPAMEDNPQWKGRRASMEDNLQWKTTFDGRQRWKMIFNGRQSSIEDNLQLKMTSYRKILRFRSAIYGRFGHFFRTPYYLVYWSMGLANKFIIIM